MTIAEGFADTDLKDEFIRDMVLSFVFTFLVVLFVMLAMRGIKIAKNSPDMFGRLLASGITMWIILQAFINISANIALVPLTGIPLPFISYGGTSLLFLMAAIGILLNISKQSNLDS